MYWNMRLESKVTISEMKLQQLEMRLQHLEQRLNEGNKFTGELMKVLKLDAKKLPATPETWTFKKETK